MDPLWAILSADDAKHGEWDLTRFLATGEADVARVVEVCDEFGLPHSRHASFELGCGVGRMTRALSTRFDEAVGVDISATMIERAVQINADRPGCQWHVDTTGNLGAFPDGAFDLVLSFIVLQHLPRRAVILSYVAEMARILAPGGALVIQIPASLPLRQRVQWRRRAYGLLRRLGVPARVLYERLGLDPIRMTGVPRAVVEERLCESGVTLVAVMEGWLGDGSTTGREINLTYIVSR